MRFVLNPLTGLLDRVNQLIKIYDAVVDITGGGDFTTIQAALDDGHTTIFVRNGTYVTNSDITLPGTPASNIKIIGENRQNTIIDFNSGNNQFTAAGYVDCLISGLTIRDSTATDGAITETITTVNRFDIDDCIFSGNTLHIQLSSFRYGRITNCFLTDHSSTGKAIDLDSSALRAIIAFNIIEQSSFGGNAEGIHVVGSECQIVFNNINRIGKVCIETGIGSRNVVSNNGLTPLPAGIGSGAVRSILMASNQSVVSQNNMNATAAPGDGGIASIEIQGNQNMINNNMITTGDADGILINGNFDNNIITSNYVKVTGAGINIATSTANNTIITNNNVADSTTKITDSGTGTEQAHNLIT